MTTAHPARVYFILAGSCVNGALLMSTLMFCSTWRPGPAYHSTILCRDICDSHSHPQIDAAHGIFFHHRGRYHCTFPSFRCHVRQLHPFVRPQIQYFDARQNLNKTEVVTNKAAPPRLQKQPSLSDLIKIRNTKRSDVLFRLCQKSLCKTVNTMQPKRSASCDSCLRNAGFCNDNDRWK